MLTRVDRRRQQGQGVVEFVIVFLAFAALLMGLFEMTRVFRAKHTLNQATFAAARAGALNNARVGPMNAELANNMAALFGRGGGAGDAPAAVVRARAFTGVLGPLGGAVSIVSPTRSVFDEFGVEQYLAARGDAAPQLQTVIPNDNLRWRPHQARSVNIGGDDVALNLQDANLLKIRSLWCHRLVVPGLDVVIERTLALFGVSQRLAVCRTLSAVSGGLNIAVPPGVYIPIAADATLRMQSPIVGNDLP